MTSKNFSYGALSITSSAKKKKINTVLIPRGDATCIRTLSGGQSIVFRCSVNTIQSTNCHRARSVGSSWTRALVIPPRVRRRGPYMRAPYVSFACVRVCVYVCVRVCVRACVQSVDLHFALDYRAHLHGLAYYIVFDGRWKLDLLHD